MTKRIKVKLEKSIRGFKTGWSWVRYVDGRMTGGSQQYASKASALRARGNRSYKWLFEGAKVVLNESATSGV